jgi:hypothetical protein
MYCSIPPAICKLESSTCDTVIRMEQYIPDTPAYLSWNPLLVVLWSEWNSTYLTGMYCSILITVSQEEDSNLHMQWCQVCTAPFWSQYHKKRIPTYICRGVRYACICKLESSSCDTVIRMEQYIPDTTAYVSWNPFLVILWSEWNSTYPTPLHMQVIILFLWYCILQGCQVCTVPIWSQYHKKSILNYICRGVRYVLFHSDHSITRRGFQLTYAGLHM